MNNERPFQSEGKSGSASGAALWLGASISIAEIVTGSLLAPLGFVKAALAIVAGHLAGCLLIGAVGLISWTRKENAMESVAGVFGDRGGTLIALCNVLQLLGWTVLMIVQAAGAVQGIFPAAPFKLLALALSALTLVWALAFGSPAKLLNNIVVCLLIASIAALVVGGGASAFGNAAGTSLGALAEKMPFFLAVELSIAMPVSWLPLVGDYSRDAQSKTGASLVPAAAYFAGSTLMYLFGLHIALAHGGDFFSFLSASRFRLAACAVVTLSTLTTAFLDLNSAALSAKFFGAIFARKNKEGEVSPYGRTSLRPTPSAGDTAPRNAPPRSISCIPTRGAASALRTPFNDSQTELELKIFDAAHRPLTPSRVKIALSLWKARLKAPQVPLFVIGITALALAVFFPIERYETLLEGFLLTIGSVFVPIYTVVILDWMTISKKGAFCSSGSWLIKKPFIAAAAGIAAYQLSMRLGFWLPTVLCMAVSAGVYLVAGMMQKETFDYTKWQENLFEDMSIEEIYNNAAKLRNENMKRKHERPFHTKGEA
ncbi:MAG: hypothetical protein LBT01_00855 [Spirochaetaceae bacterium]|jgi:putative hydroxymethylpyrimidine transporter CytX|nr:hypothetical protein [Spirochaetaceae bacterium]